MVCFIVTYPILGIYHGGEPEVSTAWRHNVEVFCKSDISVSMKSEYEVIYDFFHLTELFPE